MSKNFSAENLHKYCISRWEYYKEKDGAYLPSKHDAAVFSDASEYFKLSESACEYWFNKVDKVEADKKVKGIKSQADFKALCDEIVKGNGENPWGTEETLKKFDAIVSEIKKCGISGAYVNVSMNENEYNSSGQYLFETGLYGCISITNYPNGNVGFIDDGNNAYTMERNKIASVMCGISETDDPLVKCKYMFRVLMKNGNIVSMYFDYSSKNVFPNYQTINSVDTPLIPTEDVAKYISYRLLNARNENTIPIDTIKKILDLAEEYMKENDNHLQTRNSWLNYVSFKNWCVKNKVGE